MVFFLWCFLFVSKGIFVKDLERRSMCPGCGIPGTQRHRSVYGGKYCPFCGIPIWNRFVYQARIINAVLRMRAVSWRFLPEHGHSYPDEAAAQRALTRLYGTADALQRVC